MRTIYRSSFDEGFEYQDAENSIQKPVGWEAVWLPGEKPGPVQPEFRTELRSRGDKGIRTGENGVKMAHAYAFFDACLFRSFAAQPGADYRAEVWATAESLGGLACRIGLASGAPAFLHTELPWSPWYGTDDNLFRPYHWQPVSIEHTATADHITVYLRCKCRDAVQVNAGFFDDVALYLLSENDPPAGSDGLMHHIGRLGDALEGLEEFVTQDTRTCLLVD